MYFSQAFLRQDFLLTYFKPSGSQSISKLNNLSRCARVQKNSLIKINVLYSQFKLEALALLVK